MRRSIGHNTGDAPFPAMFTRTGMPTVQSGGKSTNLLARQDSHYPERVGQVATRFSVQQTKLQA